MSAELFNRVKCSALHSKITTPSSLIPFFKNGMAMGWSGFTATSYPKVLPLALADHVEKNNLKGKLRFDIFAGASVGDEVEDRFADLEMTRSRWPYQSGRHSQEQINSGKIDMGDIHLSVFAQDIAFGFFGKRDESSSSDDFHNPISKPTLDVSIIEVSQVLPNGGLVMGPSISIAPEIVEQSKHIILEVNTASPLGYRDMQDVYPDIIPPNRKPFLINKVSDRIGIDHVPCSPDKIIGVIESNIEDKHINMSKPTQESITIAEHISEFFKHEVRHGRLPKSLLPLQSGVGNIANAVVGGLATSDFENLEIWTEVFQDGMLDIIDAGKLKYASTAALAFSPEGYQRFKDKFDEYKQKIVVRPQQITNHPELIRRLGVIAMNTPVEVDIYAHVNSTLVGGTKMIHGLGGSGDFFRSGYISIVHCPSARPTKTDPLGISCIIPKATHVDHTEHDIDVICTEQGLADLRGLHPRLRAKTIIEKCAHPYYKDQLLDYYTTAEKICLKNKAGHEPHLLERAYEMHLNLKKNGTMKLS